MSLVSGLAIAGFGFLLDRSPFPLGYQIVFAVSFVAAIINVYYFGRLRVPSFRPEPAQPTAGSTLAARFRGFVRPFAESRAFVRYNLATLLYRLALAMPAGLFSIYWVNNLHASNAWIGMRGTAGYAALVVGYWFWGRVAGRIGHRTLLIVCGAALAFYPALTALAPTAQWLLPAALLWGFVIGGLDIGFFDMLLASCPEGRQPSFAAAANVLLSVATSVGPLLGAGLASAIGIRAALLGIAALQLATVALFPLLPSREQEGLK